MKESGVLFYALGLIDPRKPLASIGQVGIDNLDELGDTTGGQAFWVTSKLAMIEQANEISTHLRHQYTIGFKPAAPGADNKWHAIKIKVTLPPPPASGKHPTPSLRYREGYFSR